MDKKNNKIGVRRAKDMIKKYTILVTAMVFIFLASGCETLKGITRGTASGIEKDIQNVKDLDGKMQEELW